MTRIKNKCTIGKATRLQFFHIGKRKMNISPFLHLQSQVSVGVVKANEIVNIQG